MALIGVLDWPTKRYLLDQVGSDVPWQVKKKIDLRYHELSEQGYYETIRQAGLVSHLVDETSIELAMRWPPSDTPAALRGRSIREFTGGDTRVSANWHDVIIRSGRTRRRIRLISSRTRSPRIRSKIRPRHSRD
jgi:proteasome accessory factor A